MQILILVDDYLPSPKASGRLIHDLAVEFIAQGHACTICTCDAGQAEDSLVSQEDGINVVRVRTGRLKGAGKIRRAWNEIRLSQTLWRRNRAYFSNNRFDLIISYSPTIFFGPLIRRLRTLYGVPAYLILRDIFPQWAVDLGILRKGLVWRYFRYREFQQYRAVTVIGVQSPGNRAYFEQPENRGPFQLDTLFNWMRPTPKTAIRSEPAKAGPYRTRYHVQDKVVFFYGGNIGVAQDMDNILRLAAAMSSEPQAYFLLVGEGSEVPRLRRAIETQGLTNISIQDAVSQDEYAAMLPEFDLGLISLARTLNTHNFPGKLLGYLDCGMPVLASINPGNDLGSVLTDAGAGLVSDNGDDARLLAHAQRLCRETELRATLRQNARRLLESTFSAANTCRQIIRATARQQP